MAERFIRMTHDCYDALYTLPMSDGERRVLMMIVRYTVGFHRYDCEFSDRFAANVLGMSHQGVSRAINALIEKNYIYIISKGSGPHPKKIGFNWKQISVHFRTQKRPFFDKKASILDTESVYKLVAKEKKENKNTEKKNKERFASEPPSLFSFDETEIDEQEIDPESELSDEEWMLLHSQDEDDE